MLSLCLPGAARESMAWQLHSEVATELFDEGVLSDNVIEVRQRAATFNADQRF